MLKTSHRFHISHSFSPLLNIYYHSDLASHFNSALAPSIVIVSLLVWNIIIPLLLVWNIVNILTIAVILTFVNNQYPFSHMIVKNIVTLFIIFSFHLVVKNIWRLHHRQHPNLTHHWLRVDLINMICNTNLQAKWKEDGCSPGTWSDQHGLQHKCSRKRRWMVTWHM